MGYRTLDVHHSGCMERMKYYHTWDLLADTSEDPCASHNQHPKPDNHRLNNHLLAGETNLSYTQR